MANKCNTCPNWKLWEKASKACACCVDAKSGHGVIRVQATEFTVNAAPKAVDYSPEPSDLATSLSPRDENRLRIALSALFSLDPVDLLLVQHLMQERSLESFADTMKGVVDRVHHYRGSPRAMAWARKEGILKKFPQFRSVITTTGERDAAKRVEDELHGE